MKVIRGIKIKEILRNEQVKKELLIVLKGYIFWYVSLAVSYVSCQAIKFLYLLDSGQLDYWLENAKFL